jgi:hypothetical protein
MTLLPRPAFAAAALAAFASPGVADAAPQILGVVASNGAPTPLVCDGAECGAHFSAFCLQEARPAPAEHQGYSLAPGGTMTLIVAKADGRTLRLPAEPYVDIASQIGFTSVRIAVSKSTLAELGAVGLAIEVGPAVSLLPEAIANDAAPQTPEEIEFATGTMRQVATGTFDAPNPNSDAARIASLFINALPAAQPESADLRETLWASKQADPVIANATEEGLAMAKSMYESCRISVEARSSYAMRSCLELRHADLQATANHRFWKDTAGY